MLTDASRLLDALAWGPLSVALVVAGVIALASSALLGGRLARGQRFVLRLIAFIACIEIVATAVTLPGVGSSRDRILSVPFAVDGSLLGPDPYLIYRLAPGRFQGANGITYSHNEHGYRGAPLTFDGHKTRIAAIGGSTVYGTHVEDGETWPAQLAGELGERFEILNLGIPGHGTTEHVVLTAFDLPDLQVDIVLIQAGLGDLDIVSDPVNRPDTAIIHAERLARVLESAQSGARPLRIISLFSRYAGATARRRADALGRAPRAANDPPLSSEERSARHFRRNLSATVLLAKRLSARVLLVPQPVSVEMPSHVLDDPWVRRIDVPKQLQRFNVTGADVAALEGIEVVRSVADRDWQAEHFIAPGLLSPSGHRALAGEVAQYMREHPLGPGGAPGLSGAE